MTTRNARFIQTAAVTLAIAVFGALLPSSSNAEWETRSLVYLNGEPIVVYFNDGDSFRILEGKMFKGKARLMGFNTLESFGPAHSWGGWHPYELYINAKQATLNARRGVWHCFYEGDRDGYGRMLIECPDLAIDQIRKGYAHAMQIDDTPSRPEFLRAQQEAIAAGRGMWKKGVPELVLTSLHSVAEDPGRDSHYNRLVSTRDGHTEKWRHADSYSECQQICNVEIRADISRAREVARSLRAHPQLSPLLAEHRVEAKYEGRDDDHRNYTYPHRPPSGVRGGLGVLRTPDGPPEAAQR